MSTVQRDELIFDGENYRQSSLPIKQFYSERKHNIRKHALGEIKNVIHNHASITPFKGRQVPGPSKHVCVDLLNKRSQQLQSQIVGQQQIKSQPVVTTKSEELHKIDLPTPRSCNSNCHKGLEEIWSEMNVLEPDVLERLINGNEENDFDLSDSDLNIPTIDFDDELYFDSDPYVCDVYELENRKMLDKILADDYAQSEFPLANDWMDDL